MKFITSIIALLVLTVLATPAFAQTPQQAGPVTLTFRLSVQGVACPNTTYWGAIGVAGGEYLNFVQLTDPEGDGTYTGTLTHTAGQWLVRIIQGQGVARADPTQVSPPLNRELLVPGGVWQIIRDFGTVTLTENMVFEGSVVGCPAGLPDTGGSDSLPVAPLAAGLLVLTAGAYLLRRMWQHV